MVVLWNPHSTVHPEPQHLSGLPILVISAFPMAAKAAFGVLDVTWQAFAVAQGMKQLFLLQLSHSTACHFSLI